LFDSKITSPELDRLGRCSREESCESSHATIGGLQLMLHFINGELLNLRITSTDGRLAKLLGGGKSDSEILEDIYLSTFSRAPKQAEVSYWENELSQINRTQERRELLQDLFWSILTSEEFRTNH
ncbi:MAG TPA: hypothetical protein DIW81_01265, partial [Planctomycetaceae bacterium]|nr:hypothetical protein [Planctomycetaceae bacterium]